MERLIGDNPKFDTALKAILKFEGGYVNDAKDPGGETKYGISKRAYPNEDIKNLSLARAKEIYKADYWDVCRCDNLPDPLALFVFDCAVNQGTNTAIRMLQEVVGVKADGVIGQKTILAAIQIPQEDALLYLVARVFRYVRTNGFERYGKGWLKRLFLLAAEK